MLDVLYNHAKLSGARISPAAGAAKNVEFLANVNSRSRSLYAIARPSVVCLSSVTLVHPTQPIVTFGNISTALGTLAIH